MRLFLEICFRNLYYFFANKNIHTFYKLVWKYGDKKRYVPAKINFLSYRVNVPDCLSFIYQYKEIFADNSYRFESENDHPVIIDCGSNIGLSILFFKELYPH